MPDRDFIRPIGLQFSSFPEPGFSEEIGGRLLKADHQLRFPRVQLKLIRILTQPKSGEPGKPFYGPLLIIW